MENKKPLSPHIQIYSWHISSLVSISHRITGIINIIAITVICFWSCWLILGENNYDFMNYFLGSLISKFIILGVVWSFSFQILSEIRHLIMNIATKKWIFLKLSSIVLIPLMLWFIVNFVSIYDKSYFEVLNFFSDSLNKFLFSLFIIFAYFFSALSISEVFEDYINNEKIKNVANRALQISAIAISFLTIITIFNLN